MEKRNSNKPQHLHPNKVFIINRLFGQLTNKLARKLVGKDSQDLKIFFHENFAISEPVSRMFSTGSASCFNTACFSITDELNLNHYNKRFLSCLEQFPDWHAERLIYLCILLELTQFDNVYCLERDYHIGAAATLLDAASPDKVYWVNSGNIEHYYWGEESEHLQVWLSQGWSYDELLADPLLTELERQKNILKHRQNDISVSDQIKKFIDFQNNQKKASEIKPVIGE